MLYFFHKGITMLARTVRTYAKGQIVIPGFIRKKLCIKPGSRLKIFERKGVIYLMPQSRDNKSLMDKLFSARARIAASGVPLLDRKGVAGEKVERRGGVPDED
jgi:AbrB family looped-hinge helix DNA binding protein